MKTIIAFLAALLFTCQASVLAGESPEYFQSFNPPNVFKPAQKDLTEIFLQLAGSLECYGSPEPYLRHVKSEEARVVAKYQQKFGKPCPNFCPAYMTDDYIDRLAKNWNALSPKLGLKPLTQDIGHLMRLDIKGTRDTGTIVVEIFNEHQKLVFDSMTRAGDSPADFDLLESNLVARLELNKKDVNEEKYEIPRRDAVSYAIIIQGVTMKLFKKLDANLKPEDAEHIKAALTSVYIDVGRMAQSELEAGIAEWALDNQTATASIK